MFSLTRKPRFRLYDSQFAHAKSSGSCFPRQGPSFFNWEREKDVGNIAFFTDSSLELSANCTYPRKVAWLLESPQVHPEAIDYIARNFSQFNYVLTHQSRLLTLDERFLFSPAGGCWIREADARIYPKSKLLSMILSRKNHLEGHRLRLLAATRFGSQMDLYGPGHQAVKNKVTALRDHAFSLVIENHRSDFYFTEKLIDAFACGTIPVYWGCPSIDRFFDKEGMISFSSMSELGDVINTLSMDMYHSKRSAIQANFEAARQLCLAEDWMWEHYRNKLFRVQGD